MKRTVLIAREFRGLVMRKGFIFSTLLMPLFMIGVFVIPMKWSEWTAETAIVAVLDDADVGKALVAGFEDMTFDSGVPKYEFEFVPEGADLEAYKERVKNKELRALLVLPENLAEENKAQLFMRSLTQIEVQRDLERTLTGFVREVRMQHHGVTREVVNAVLTPLNLETTSVLKDQGDGRTRFLMSMLVAFVLYMTLVLYGSQIMLGVVEDKAGKVYEVLQSCVSARDILLAKVVGVASATVVQYLVWGGALLALRQVVEVEVLDRIQSDALLFHLVPIFLVGYMVYAFLYAALGSIVESSQEAQQVSMPLTMMLVIPLVLMGPMSNDPDGVMPVALSIFPFTSPIVMPMRLGATAPELWQVIACYGMLGVTLVVSYIVSGKIFETAIMIQGKTPLKQAIRWVFSRD